MTQHDYTDHPGYTGYQGYQGYEPEPPARTVKITHLVFGVVFLGIVALWALGTRGDISAGDVPVLIPAVLIGAGVVGLVAAALTPLLRRRSTPGDLRRGGANYRPYGAEAAQTTSADPTEAAQTTPGGEAEAADAEGIEARELTHRPPAEVTQTPRPTAEESMVEEGRHGPSRDADATAGTDNPDNPTEEIR